MTGAMKLSGALLLIGLCGCVPLPVVSLRVRARLQQTESRTGRSLEARVDCGWALDSAGSQAAAPRLDAEPPTALERERVPCEVASACAWETSARGTALAALAPEPLAFSTGEAP